MPIATDSFLFHSIQSFSVPDGTSKQVPLHHHPDTVELLLVLNGTIHCQIDGQTYHASAGTVLFIQAGSWHEQLYVASDTYCGYRLTFCPLDPASYANYPSIISISQIANLKSLFLQLQLEKEQPGADSKQMAHHLINAILLFVYRSATKPETNEYSNVEATIQEIKYYMEENHSQTLSLEELAERFELNKYQLARLFKQVTDMSPLQYIISCRINTAKYLLCTSDSPISKISSKVGYKSNTQFQAAFKKATGLTPRQYRIQQYQHTVQ
ncbi:transcriptional regulator, AraC family [Planococcus sp. PAMC 21323]|uniref:AraC family transcriptional regulator n=1 Tax=Planococcus sp. PAMC 21323 TaxID=1526927 RepID=UPI00056E0813|nr:AraC family transcriptional regulator [Planococcus sp. PAMC 21323]AIY05461.1 transcriptional regulator, AraC family [Planococcus sp. PAMC 21323]